MNGIGGRGRVAVAAVAATAAVGLVACGSSVPTYGGGGASRPPGALSSGGGVTLKFVGSPCQALSLDEVAAAVGPPVTYGKDVMAGGTISIADNFCSFGRPGAAVPLISTSWIRAADASVDTSYDMYRTDNVPAGADVSGLGLKAVCGTGSSDVSLVIKLADRAWKLTYDFRGLDNGQQSPPAQQAICDSLTALARHGIDRIQGSGQVIKPTPGTAG